ncbi:MAG: site-2 protease family protein [Endomicrobium sp.]|jgi:Zn-dependent protease|nr:site-2 protease family protein [Endomicrobium sp.]
MNIFVYIVILLFSAIVHEIAHGYTAYLRGDNTAKILGRVTLNPVPHIDFLGSIILPVILLFLKSPILFGWAKSVPIDYNKLKNPKIDNAIVSLSGPVSNILLAFFSGLIIRFTRLFLNFEVSESIISFFYVVLNINVILAIINLIPIPPLDGSKVITCFLPKNFLLKYLNLNSYIWLIVLFLLLSSNVTWKIIIPIINFFVIVFSGINY